MYSFISEPDAKLLTEQMFPKVNFLLKDEASLSDMVDAFEDFLRASGYCFDGHLTITEETPDAISEEGEIQ